MSLVDDSRLLQLARPPAGEIFLVLNRASALKPLLVLLAIVPGLYALQYRTLTASDALWGLRTIAVLNAGNIEAIADPSSTGPESVLRFESPLGTWLDALAMWLLGPAFPGVVLASSYLSLVALVWLVYVLFRRLAGTRIGVLAAALVSCHGPVLALASTAAPEALATTLAVMTFWSYLGHLQETTAVASLRLLLGGIALGLCLLAGGPLALLVAAVLLIYVLGLRGESVRKRRGGETKPVRTWVGWPALRSLAVMIFTAFAVAGWWPLMMFSRHGLPFLSEWLSGPGSIAVPAPLSDEAAPRLLGRLISEFAVVLGPYLALSGVGFVRAIQTIRNTVDETHRRWLVFLLSWTGCGFLVWMTTLLQDQTLAPTATQWQAFFVVPSVALAALGIDEIARRRVHVLVVALAACGMLAFFTFLWLRLRWEALGIVTQTTSLALSLAVVVIAFFWLGGIARSRDARERLVLASLVLAQLFAAGVAGLQLVHRTDDDDLALRSFRSRLVALAPVDAVAVINEPQLPLELQFTLRSLWPRAEWMPSATWDATFAQALTGERSAAQEFLVLDWSERDIRPASLQVPGLSLVPVPTPEFFAGRQLRVYRLSRVSEKTGKSA